jgi:hypothetical protein
VSHGWNLGNYEMENILVRWSWLELRFWKSGKYEANAKQNGLLGHGCHS